MNTDEKYRQVFSSMEHLVQLRREEGLLAALGYTSNLDLLCLFSIDKLNHMIGEYLPGADLASLECPGMIHTMEDLVSVIAYYCIHGIGGECDIADMSLATDHMEFTYGMGGTAVQAAMALSEVDCPALVHLTDDSPEVCSQLDKQTIYTVSPEGELIHTGDKEQTQEQEIHFIIQFRKGDQIQSGNTIYEIPVSNRLILTNITVNEYVPFSKPYFQWIEDYSDRVTSNVLSSFNCIFSEEILKQRLKDVCRHVATYHKNNPKGIVFYEDAHYHDSLVKRLVVETLYPICDIISMNEDELSNTVAEVFRTKINTQDIFSVLKMVSRLKEYFGIRKGVVIHTKDYSMYFGDEADADIEEGLMLGNLLATAKAENGGYGTREQIRQILNLSSSSFGLECRAGIAESEYAGKAVLVPSKYIEHAKYTIGLGDSFIGGLQMCFMNGER